MSKHTHTSAKNTKKVALRVLIGLVLIGIIAALVLTLNKPGKSDDFAKCLDEKGAKFYGAFWCPHCRNQKTMFGTSAKHLPYIECSTPDGKSQLASCSQRNVHEYPTWEFADGSRMTGEIPLATLAQKTGCTLPPEQ